MRKKRKKSKILELGQNVVLVELFLKKGYFKFNQIFRRTAMITASDLSHQLSKSITKKKALKNKRKDTFEQLTGYMKIGHKQNICRIFLIF